ncbi:MAG: tRNA (N6-threonylcarbamoyladenosine(37)-N6)-methyltransferase TrmO [Spongiibacteraceae bacterium]
MTFQFSQVGTVHSPYREKFAIPRQPGLAKVDAVIELLPPFAQPDAVSGLEQFSHIWLTFVFHALTNKAGDSRDWKPLVRPPRLGGNEKLGVFATRSTHRPNPIGLSVVELLRVEIDNGVRLHIRGADLLDGTPVLDIKPYIPYADAIANARGGFAQDAPTRLNVRWNSESLRVAHNSPLRITYDLSQCVTHNETGDLKSLIEEILSFDPRPAYQDEPDRIYGVLIDNYNVRFRIDREGVEVIAIEQDMAHGDE